jgi:hypothetical protein
MLGQRVLRTHRGCVDKCQRAKVRNTASGRRKRERPFHEAQTETCVKCCANTEIRYLKSQSTAAPLSSLRKAMIESTLRCESEHYVRHSS